MLYREMKMGKIKLCFQYLELIQEFQHGAVSQNHGDLSSERFTAENLFVFAAGACLVY